MIGINKKKCYAEALFEIIIFLYIHSNNVDYYSVLYQIFIKWKDNFKSIDKNYFTIVAYIDSIKGQSEKGNLSMKIFK